MSVVKELKTSNIHNKNVKIGMFANPIGNKYFSLETESPLREIFGVHHIKFYVFDDNVILSGANLSEDYFTDR